MVCISNNFTTGHIGDIVSFFYQRNGEPQAHVHEQQEREEQVVIQSYRDHPTTS
jgi:hypothetical protein